MKWLRMRIRVLSVTVVWILIGVAFVGMSNIVENVEASGFRMDSFLSDSHASFLGEDEGDRSGIKVAMAGDVNGDGYDDILIGADSDEEAGDTAGKAYLIFGKGSGWDMDVNLSNADASFLGEDQGDMAGWAVAGAGDVNSDGYDDILIGAWRDEEFDTNAGQTYLIFGKSSGWARDVNLSNSDASFLGELNGAYSGYSVDGCGDVNGDGFDDILIGARYDDEGGFEFGQVYIIFGKSTGWAMDTSLSSADASYWGEDSSDFAGMTVAGAGDVNGDGLDDILIGATGDEEGGGNNAGQTYLILGKTSGWAMDVSLSNADASFIGEDAGDNSGISIDGRGDVNGDGYDDFLIGANFDEEAGSNAGQTYLILGKASGWVMDVSLLYADASFLGEDAGDSSGLSVAICGDVNSDGYDDILIGAGGDEDGGSGAGQSYLILGKQTGWAMDTSLSDSDASFWGEDSLDNSGWAVAGGGDVNSDGYDDILIGAYFDEEGGGNGAGQTYLVFYESAPSEPVNVEAWLSQNGSHINLTWRDSEFWKKISDYIIYRSEDGVNYNEIAVLDESTLTFMDSNVTLGHEYIYTIIATSGGPYESPMSEPVSILCDYDTDLDKIGNIVDLDDDGDGVSDGADAFPLDANEWLDTDFDGIGNNEDTDDDNDGIPDLSDSQRLNPFNDLETYLHTQMDILNSQHMALDSAIASLSDLIDDDDDVGPSRGEILDKINESISHIMNLETNGTLHNVEIQSILDSLSTLIENEHGLTKEEILVDLSNILTELQGVESNLSSDIDKVDAALNIVEDDEGATKDTQDSMYSTVMLAVVLLVIILIVLLIVLGIIIKENKKLRKEMEGESGGLPSEERIKEEEIETLKSEE